MSARAKGQGDLETIEWPGGAYGYEARQSEAISKRLSRRLRHASGATAQAGVAEMLKPLQAASLRKWVGQRAFSSSRSRYHCTNRGEQYALEDPAILHHGAVQMFRFSADTKGFPARCYVIPRKRV